MLEVTRLEDRCTPSSFWHEPPPGALPDTPGPILRVGHGWWGRMFTRGSLVPPPEVLTVPPHVVTHPPLEMPIGDGPFLPYRIYVGPLPEQLTVPPREVP